MRCKGALLHLHKIMKPQIDLDRESFSSIIQNYEELPPLIPNVEALYTQLFRSLDVVARNYDNP